MNTKLYLIQIHQAVYQSFKLFFKEAKDDGDYEIVNSEVLNILKQRGFKFTIEEASYA